MGLLSLTGDKPQDPYSDAEVCFMQIMAVKQIDVSGVEQEHLCCP